MKCENCGKDVDGTTGLQVSVGFENESERTEYTYCGWECLHEYAGNLPLS